MPDRDPPSPGAPWSRAEDAVLAADPDATPAALAARLPGRSPGAVTNRRAVLRLWGEVPPAGDAWTAEQDAVLRGEGRDLATAEVAGRLGRTVVAVQARRRRLGLGPDDPAPPRWTAAEEARVAATADRPLAAVAAELGRPWRSVADRRFTLRRRGDLAASRRWTAADDAALLARPEATAAELAAELGRTVLAVHQRRHRLRERGA